MREVDRQGSREGEREREDNDKRLRREVNDQNELPLLERVRQANTQTNKTCTCPIDPSTPHPTPTPTPRTISSYINPLASSTSPLPIPRAPRLSARLPFPSLSGSPLFLLSSLSLASTPIVLAYYSPLPRPFFFFSAFLAPLSVSALRVAFISLDFPSSYFACFLLSLYSHSLSLSFFPCSPFSLPLFLS